MHMNGYGSHTFSLIDAQGGRVWVKFHFKTRQGHQHLTNDQAAEKIGQTREGYQEALFGAIEAGDFPKWDLKIQVMTEAQAEAAPFNPFDLTKVWPHGDYPLIDVGVMELNRNPDNYFAEIENAAFSPSNIVPGIGFSPDKVLQARIFSYADAHRYRLGTHYEQLPVNRPKCPVHHYHKDGPMNVLGQQSGALDAYYEPNRFGGASQSPDYAEPPLALSGTADRHDHRAGNDDYSQPRALHDLMTDDQRARLYANTAAAMAGVPDEIIDVALSHYDRISQAYGDGIRAARAHLAGQSAAAE